MITVAKLEIENVIVASHLGKDIELIDNDSILVTLIGIKRN